MINNQHHIENWLQQSANNATVPFNTEHWVQMEKLLQQKKKRRFLFWSFWGVLLGLLVVGILFWQYNKPAGNKVTSVTVKELNHQQPQKQSAQKGQPVHQTHSNTKDSIAFVHQPQDTIAQQPNKKNVTTVIVEADKQLKKATIKDVAKPKTKSLYYTNNKKDSKKNRSVKQNVKKDTIQSNRLAKRQSSKSIKSKTISTAIDTKNENVEDSTTSTEKYDYHSFVKQKTVAIVFPPPIKGIRLKDTVFNYPTKKAVKKQQSQYGISGFFVEGGYYRYNNTSVVNNLYFAAGYQQKIVGNAFLAVNLSVTPINSSATQQHEQISNPVPIPGTTIYTANITNTTFTVGKGLSFQTGLTVGYAVNKFSAQVGVGFVFNKTSPIITSVIDTLGIYNVAQLNDVRGKTENFNNAFNGMQQWTMNASLQYYITQQWYCKAKYFTSFNKSKVLQTSGASLDNSGFSISTGYFFRKKLKPKPNPKN